MLPTLKEEEYPEAEPVIPKLAKLPAANTGKEELNKLFLPTHKEFLFPIKTIKLFREKLGY